MPTPILPQLRDPLLNFAFGQTGSTDFESWLYTHLEIEPFFPPEDFQILIAYDYRTDPCASRARRIVAQALYQHVPEFWNTRQAQRTKALLADIEAAFRDISRIGGASWHQAIALDDRRPEQDVLRAAEQDTDTHWQDVPDSLLNANAPLVFLDAIGLRYYLPFCMRWVLKRRMDPGHVAATEWLLITFVISPNRYAHLTHEQSRSVALFLLQISLPPTDFQVAHLADDALQAYWGQFLTF